VSLPVVLRSVADLAAVVGHELGPGPWLTIDPRRVRAFHGSTDPAAPAPGGAGYSEQVTTDRGHYLPLVLISSMAADLYDLQLGSARLNYGLDRVRFTDPVPVGARVRLRCTLAEPRVREGSVLVPIDFVVDREGADRPACIARKLSLVLLD